MSQNSSYYWAYLFLLGFFFGLLYLLGFVIPHYDPESNEDHMSSSPDHTMVATPQTDTTELQEVSISDKKDNTEASFSETNIQTGVEFFDSLKKKYQTSILNELRPNKPRKDVIIRYYKHPPDGDKVYALRDLGFYIHERPVDQEMTEYESNSIFYGDSVRKEDLLIVAYTLIQQGIPIKNIKPSLYHDGWKYNAIEIGADSTIIDKDVLTLDELQNYPL